MLFSRSQTAGLWWDSLCQVGFIHIICWDSTPYKHVNANEDGGEFGAGEARYNTILSVLTADELNQIEFVVTVDSKGGTISGVPYVIKGTDGRTFAEPNDIIKLVRSKYQIGLKIINENTKIKVENALNEIKS